MASRDPALGPDPVTTGICRGCGRLRPVPDEGTKRLFSGDNVAFVMTAVPHNCGARVVKIDLRQFDENPEQPEARA